MNTRRIVVAATAFSLLTALSIHAGEYFQDFSGSAVGATNFSDGSQLFSTSYSVANVVVPPYNELQLTASGISSVTSAFELPALDSGTPVYAFSAKWNMPVYGTFGSATAADGFSFNYGQLSSVNLTNGTVESGYGVGLSFGIQTYAYNAPGFYIRSGTNVIAKVPYNPATEWGNNNGMPHFIEVDWNYYTGMTVRMDGTNIFSNVIITNFTPSARDRIVFAARCGDYSEEIRLDNIAVVTGGNLVPLPAGAPYYSAGNDFLPVTNAFDGNSATYWESHAGVPSYIGATFLPSNAVAAYTMTSANASSGNNPSAWTLQASNDGGNTWTNGGSGGGYFEYPMETHCLLATDAGASGVWRLDVTATANNNPPCLAELRMYALSVVGPPFKSWVQANVPAGGNASDPSMVGSQDGKTLYYDGGILGLYVSTNGGANWTAPGAGNFFLACTPDGTKAFGLEQSRGLYISTNSGATWTLSSYPWGNGFWDNAVGVSGDGTKLSAAKYGVFSPSDEVYYSTDSGNTWNQSYVGPNFLSMGMGFAGSLDGSMMAMVTAQSGIYVSRNYGATYTQVVGNLTICYTVACSTNGQIIVAGTASGVMVSTDFGTNWTTTSFDGEGVACSANGKRIFAADDYGNIMESGNAGSTWSSIAGNANPPGWGTGNPVLTCSGDGASVVVAYNSGNVFLGPSVFATPSFAPVLSESSTGIYPTVSWPNNSGGNFILQQSGGLSANNWTNVSWPVTSSQGSYQVTVPNSGGDNFFRLKTP